MIFHFLISIFHSSFFPWPRMLWDSNDRPTSECNRKWERRSKLRQGWCFVRDRLHSLITLDMSGYKKRRASSERLLLLGASEPHVIFYLWKKRIAPATFFCYCRHSLLVSCVCLYQNTRALRLFVVVFTQCDVCRQSRTFQHKHDMRREKRKKNRKIGESSKVERMLLCTDGLTTFFKKRGSNWFFIRIEMLKQSAASQKVKKYVKEIC